MVVLNNHKYDTLACLAIDLGLPAPPFYTTKKELIDQLIRAISITKRDMNSVTEGILFDKKIKKLLFEHDEFFKLSTQEREYFWQTEFLKLQIKERESGSYMSNSGMYEQLVKDAPILIDGLPVLNGSSSPINDRLRTFEEINDIAVDQPTPVNPRSRRTTQPPVLEPLPDLDSALNTPFESPAAFTVERVERAPRQTRRRSPRNNTPDFVFVEDDNSAIMEVEFEERSENIDREEIEDHQRRVYSEFARNVNGSIGMVPFEEIPPESMISSDPFRTFEELDDE